MHIQTEPNWRPCLAPILPTPVFALAGGQDWLWAGGVGGVTCGALSADRDAQTGEDFWQPGRTVLPLSAVTALLAYPEVLIAGGSEGLAYSTDAGKSWQRAALEDGMVSITALAASPAFVRDHIAVAATLTNGILRTRDGGRSWTSASFGLSSLEVHALLWIEEQMLLAVTDEGVYRSRDGGRAWKCLTADVDADDWDGEALAILPGGTILVALTRGGLLRSENQGRDWYRDEQGRDEQTLSLTVTPAGTLLWGTLDGGLWRSDDDGATWQVVLESAVHVCICAADSLYIGSETGVSVSSDDGLTWHELFPPPLYDFRVLLARQDHLLLAGAYTGIVEAISRQNWQSLANLSLPLTACQLVSDDTLLLSTSDGLLSLSLAHGTLTTLFAGPDGQVAHIALRQTTDQQEIWAASSSSTRLLYSPDGGANWQSLPTPFGVLSLVALQALADRLFAATYDPRQYQVCLWYSTDDGKNWIRSIEAATRWPVVATCAEPAIVSIGNILFLERTVGQWQKITPGQDGGAIKRILSLRQNNKIHLFVLTTTGLQYSEDLGASWQQKRIDLPGASVIDLALSGTTLSALLPGGRVWQCNLCTRGV